MGASVRPIQGTAGAPGGGRLTIAPAYLDALPPQLRGNAKDYFVNVIEFLPLGAGATAQQDLRIDADSFFLILATTRVVTSVDNLTFLSMAPQLVTLYDSGAGRNLGSSAVHIEGLFGDAQDPFNWPFPKLMSPGSTLSVRLQNLEAVDRNVRLAFHGFKVFNFLP